MQPDRAITGEDQRRLKREFLDVLAAGVVGGVEGEVEKGGAGYDRHAVHGVVGQPGVFAEGEAAREQVDVVGEFGYCGQEGV
ncbi:MAG: hypothetical protein WCD21_37720, partial [Streptomyces sp.]